MTYISNTMVTVRRSSIAIAKSQRTTRSTEKQKHNKQNTLTQVNDISDTVNDIDSDITSSYNSNKRRRSSGRNFIPNNIDYDSDDINNAIDDKENIVQNITQHINLKHNNNTKSLTSQINKNTQQHQQQQRTDNNFAIPTLPAKRSRNTQPTTTITINNSNTEQNTASTNGNSAIDVKQHNTTNNTQILPTIDTNKSNNTNNLQLDQSTNNVQLTNYTQSQPAIQPLNSINNSNNTSANATIKPIVTTQSTILVDTTPVKRSYAASYEASSAFDAAIQNTQLPAILSPRSYAQAQAQKQNITTTDDNTYIDNTNDNNNPVTPLKSTQSYNDISKLTQHQSDTINSNVGSTPLVKHNKFDIDSDDDQDNNDNNDDDNVDDYTSVTEYDNLPDPYLTINPSLLDDNNWSYRDLQTLCKQVTISARGKRYELVDRLVEWHHQQFDDSRRKEQIPGSNFSMLQIKLPNIEQHPMCTPLLNKPHNKSINNSNDIIYKTATKSILSQTPRVGTIHASQHKKSIQFSVFNSVKLIPARDKTDYYEDSESDYDDESQLIDLDAFTDDQLKQMIESGQIQIIRRTHNINHDNNNTYDDDDSESIHSNVLMDELNDAADD